MNMETSRNKFLLTSFPNLVDDSVEIFYGIISSIVLDRSHI